MSKRVREEEEVKKDSAKKKQKQPERGYFVTVPSVEFNLPFKLFFGLAPQYVRFPLPQGTTRVINLIKEQPLCQNSVVDGVHTTVFVPIQDQKPPTAQQLDSVWRFLNDLEEDNQHSVYIHCKGGHGRSGAVVAAIVARFNGWSGEYTRNRIEALWLAQRDCSKLRASVLILGCPQTQAQREAVDTWSRPFALAPIHVIPFRMHTFYSEKTSVFSNFAKTKGVSATVESIFQGTKFSGEDDEAVREYSQLVITARTPTIAKTLGTQKKRFGYCSKTTLLSPKEIKKGTHKRAGQTVNEVVDEFLDKGVRLKENWEEQKVQVMANLVREKFIKDIEARAILLAPELTDTLLIEHTTRDCFWGDGGNCWSATALSGRNHLGRILTALRYKLLEDEQHPSDALREAVGKEIFALFD